MGLDKPEATTKLRLNLINTEFSMKLYDQIQESIEYIRQFTDFSPQYGIVLGTGLGNLTNDLLIACEIDYRDIPHFPVSTVQSHKGKLIFGYLKGQQVVVMSGRFHFYEGYTMQQVTFPIRVLKCLGIETIIITNVSGSTNAQMEAGDIVLINDHISLHAENPLRGENDERLGVRFPDMKNTYDKPMIAKALRIAKENDIRIHTGVYLSWQGPSLETPAEYRFIHTIGADLVGMSTIPEVIVAKHSDLKIMVISIVSNKCFPIEDIKETAIEDVIAIAHNAEPKMRLIIKELLKKGGTES
jgi:purine-nucleoside phosphorylase